MPHKNIKVKTVWVGVDGKQVGVRVSVDGREQDISINDLHSLRGRLSNADVTTYGVRGKAGITLSKQPLSRGMRQAKYNIMKRPQRLKRRVGQSLSHKAKQTMFRKVEASSRHSINQEAVHILPLELEGHGIVKEAIQPAIIKTSKTTTNKIKRPFVRATGRPVETYTLMHANDEVCRVYPELNRVEIINEQFLPFALRGVVLTVVIFMEWLNRRVDNLSRTYMNSVYIARKVGRDREKILRDSCAISIIDNYWIKRSDVKTSWEELKSKRDQNIELANVALTGQVTKEAFNKVIEDTTSLFTIKGAFPKAILKGFILKRGNNAEYEAVAYQLGNILNIAVAEAVKQEDSDIVKCRIFTTESVSMAHVQDFLHFTNYENDKDEHKAIYEYFTQQHRNDIVRQLERLYILNYLTLNMDFHYENFGILYDNSSFNIIEVAPAYDFNSAFGEWEDAEVYYNWIFKQLPIFIRNHRDIKERLQSSEFLTTLNIISDLSEEQKRCVKARVEYLCLL